MLGYHFSKYVPGAEAAPFDKMLKVFNELLTVTSGDVTEALAWLNEIENQHRISGNTGYGMGDFLQDLKDKGLLKEEGNELKITPQTERNLRRQALEDVFGKMKKTPGGQHKTGLSGKGNETGADLRPFIFGDKSEQIAFTESFKNAQIRHGAGNFMITEDDLEVREQEHLSHTATVLMIDISHSMILYGEDRITPAKKTAMALAELITTRFPKDTLDVITFGNDAEAIPIKQLPYLQVGPYHTNTVAGLELAMDILRKKKSANKQILMITDGKPTCLKIGLNYYKNSFGLDRKIINKCYELAARCRKAHIGITTFMIASDPYLQQFVSEFTEINRGKAFFSSLNGLGDFVYEDYQRNRKGKTF